MSAAPFDKIRQVLFLSTKSFSKENFQYPLQILLAYLYRAISEEVAWYW